MYSANDVQRIRKLNYSRYRSLSERGYSIEEEAASSTLFAINTDPFGRTFFQKSLGEVVVKDPLTGRPFTQEEWSTKEFIIDNKTQVVNKVSADLVVGKAVTIDFRPEDRDSDEAPDGPVPEAPRLLPTVTSELDEWLARFLRRNKVETQLMESAMRNSSLGDQYFSMEVREGQIEATYVDPYFVEIIKADNRVVGYEVAWDIEISKTTGTTLLTRSTTTERHLVMKKFYFPGFLRYELWELNRGEMEQIPLLAWEENAELVNRAFTEDHMVPMLADGMETDNPAEVMIITEFTGVDTPTLIHWPNYRMFDDYGVSDTGMIETLQNALNNRQTQLNDVLDKHADPAMAGDDAYLDENGNLPMSGVGRYFPLSSDGDAPVYLEWEGHLGDSSTEMKRLYRAILDNTETAAALVGLDEGGIQSGRALMYKLLRSLSMAARKTIYMRQAVVDVLNTAQKLRHVWLMTENPVITEATPIITAEEWEGIIFEVQVDVESAIPTDRKELIDEVTNLVESKLLTTATAVAIIEKLYEEIEAESEIAALEKEAEESAEQQRKTFGFEQVLDDDQEEPA